MSYNIYVSCNPKETATLPRITPVEPPIVNINKKRSAKSAELVLSCKNGRFPRYELNQLKIFVPVGKDIKIVTPVNKLLYQFLNLQHTYDVPKQYFQEEKYSSWQRSLIGSQRLFFCAVPEITMLMIPNAGIIKM